MVYDKLKEIIVEQLQVDEKLVTRECNIIKDLNADSLDVVEMLMNLEEEFNISIPDEAASELKTVGEIVDFVESKIK
ncbi:MAG: acyl carrier protein [Clostridia bacterium]